MNLDILLQINTYYVSLFEYKYSVYMKCGLKQNTNTSIYDTLTN